MDDQRVVGHGVSGLTNIWTEYADGSVEYGPSGIFGILFNLANRLWFRSLLSRSQPASEVFAEMDERANQAISQAQGISQAQYLEEMAAGINGLTEQLLIYGHDAPFMQDPRIYQAVTDAANRHLTIRAIVPNGTPTYLDDLASAKPEVTVLRSPNPIRAGFMVYDSKEVSHFDLDKRTPYEPETSEVILRTSSTDSAEIQKAIQRFNGEFAGLESRLK